MLLKYKIFSYFVAAATAVVFLSVPTASSIAHSSDELREVPSTPSVKSGILPNGFRYYLISTKAYGRAISIRFVTKVGSLMQRSNEPQFAHLIEHIAASRPTDALPNASSQIEQISALGGMPGIGFSAWTGSSRTDYAINIPDAPSDTLPKLLTIARGWAHGPRFSEAEIAREAATVVEEQRSSGGTPGPGQARIISELFSGTLGLQWPDLSPDTDPRVVSPDNVRSFYERWYRPDLQALSVVGDFDVSTVEQHIRENFGSLTPSKHRVAPWLQSLPHRDSHVVVQEDSAALECTVTVVAHFMGPAQIVGDRRRQEIVQSVAKQILITRWEADGKRYLAPKLNNVEFSNDDLGSDVFSAKSTVVSHACDNGAAAKEYVENLASLGVFGASDVEIREAVARVSQQTKNGQPSGGALASVVIDYGTDSIDFHDARPVIKERGSILGEDTERLVNEVLRDWSNSPARTVFVTVPPVGIDKALEGEMVRRGLETSILLPKIRSQTATLSTVRELVPVFTPKMHREESDIATILSFPEFKIRAAIISGGKALEIRGTRSGGLSRYEGKDREAFFSAVDLIKTIGVSSLDYFDLQQLRQETGMSVVPLIGAESEGFSGKANPGNLEELLSLVRLYLQPAVREGDAIRHWKDNEELRGKLPHPISARGQFEAFMSARLADRPFTFERPTNVDIERSLNLYDNVFSHGNQFTIVLRGPFDREDAVKAIRRFVGSLSKSDPPKVFARRNLMTTAYEGNTLYFGSNLASVSLVARGSYGRESKAQIEVIARMLQTRMLNRLRGIEAGTYSVSASSSFDDSGRRYFLTVNFDCDPARRLELSEAAFNEIDKFSKEKISEHEINFAISKIDRNRNDLDLSDFPVSNILDEFVECKKLGCAQFMHRKTSPEEIRKTIRNLLTRNNFTLYMLAPASEDLQKAE